MVVKVEIGGEGLNYSGETNLTKAAQIIAFINSQGGIASVPSSQVATAPVMLPMRESPREALRSSGASTIPQKIAVLGKYIADKNETSGTFSTKELQEAFRRAGEPLPGNLGRDVGIAVSQGLIAPADVSGEYYITNTAEDLIAAQFEAAPKGGGRRQHSAKVQSRSKGRKAVLSEGVDKLQLSPDQEGLPNYWSPKLKESKSARIVWLVAFAKNSGIEEISAADIAYMASRMGDEIDSSNVPSKSIGLIKKSYVAKNPSGKFRILKGGMDFLFSPEQAE